MYSIKTLFSDDVIEFRREIMDKDIDNYEHPLIYKNIKCVKCSGQQSFYCALNNGWWIDELLTDCRNNPSGKLADLCFDCRNESQIKYGKGTVQCSRCTRYGEFGEGKWNFGSEELGRLTLCYSWSHGKIFCYNCHEKIHYNK